MGGTYQGHRSATRMQLGPNNFVALKRNLRVIGIGVSFGAAAYGVIHIMILISRSMGGVI